ncbi:hypothetical protein H8K52_18370 [Undibacterium seohonense]|jgi:hypothetical protein|uniref:Uncharacterized protein n=1 Tax=Undibacterium seohonense TaxID=1344950 RepID=A0ABR6XAG0_9BURK|nr:hypothetical protein [Undibacterium seohonense]MBC3809309.1 hypothetical protein [Undibacterium seohonense]
MAAMLFYEPAFASVSDISLNIATDAPPTKPSQQITFGDKAKTNPFVSATAKVGVRNLAL